MTATRTAAAPTRAAAPALTLDDRLALAHHTMDDRLATRSAAWAVDTAHIPLEAPELLAPAPATSYSTPVAAVLQEAHRLIADRGWCRRWLTGPDGSYCLIGAIRTAADGEGPLADQAEVVLLEVIGGDSIARWNGNQTGPQPVLAALGRAACRADRRGI
ncbi:hypothetical protein ACFWJT_15835 [Streptomyces sp. NPDC127069]|uniref:DUF6197 family protein n=1 Tax=Streptomyces sp. NPDC127069 TaxID=3347128 RepID=UPI00364A4516